MIDRGTELIAEFSKMIQDDYGIKRNQSLKETHKQML